MKISIIGTGYVGLITAVCFAEVGHKVLCVDKDRKKISDLEKGIPPIIEKGLKSALKKTISRKKIFFSSKISDACKHSEIIFIAVGTPTKKNSNDADLSSLINVINEIKSFVAENKIIVIKSTVPIGTNLCLEEKYSNNGFKYISNPEFLREGEALSDARSPDRIVIGGRDNRSVKKIKSLYNKFIHNKSKLLITDPTSAEIIKYASNAFLATKIAFVNEITSISHAVNGNIADVSKGMGMDPRIGRLFLKAGPGYGGSCFPKDVKALDYLARENDLALPIISNIEKSNLNTKKRLLKRVNNYFKGKSKTKRRITIYGVSFKANTDDIRDSASIFFLKRLKSLGYRINLYDPIISGSSKKGSINDLWFSCPYEAAKNADLLIVMNDSKEFLKLNFKKISSSMRLKSIMDFRNLLDKNLLIMSGFSEIFMLDEDVFT